MAELNGVPADLDQLRCLALTNFGHFTTIRVAGSQVRALSLHLDRLVRDCRALFDADLDPDRVRHFVRHAVAGIAGPVVVRVTIFDPDLDLGNAGRAAEPGVLVTLRPDPRPAPPLRARAVRYRRDLPAVKHVGLFGTLRERRAAQRDGFDDALFVDGRDAVCEGTVWNIGFFDGERVVWPDGEQLPGITKTVIQQAYCGPAVTETVRLADLARMRAAFATNATTGVRPVALVNDVGWPVEQAIHRTLREAYERCPAERL